MLGYSPQQELGAFSRARVRWRVKIGAQLATRYARYGLDLDRSRCRHASAGLPFLHRLVLNSASVRELSPPTYRLDRCIDCVHMTATLQPIVAVRQQLTVADGLHSLQPMGTLERQAAREGFSRRFGEVLNDLEEVPRTRGRRTWIAKKWRVSTETARKWLIGLDIPDRAHLAAICTTLRVSPDWMLTGLGRRNLQDDDALFDRLQTVWGYLSDDNREQLVALAIFLHGRAPQAPPPHQPAETVPLTLRR